MPEEPLPDCLSDDQKQRYATIAALARATADRVPHATNEFSEPAHVVDRHRQVRGTSVTISVR
jgi:hypothetical protein